MSEIRLMIWSHPSNENLVTLSKMYTNKTTDRLRCVTHYV